MYSSVKITKNTSANSLQLRDFSLSGNPIIIRGKAGVNSPCHFLKVLISQAFQAITQILPWQIKSTLIIVLFLLNLPGNALPRLSFRSRQSQNARLCKHIGTLRSLLRVFCKGLGGFYDLL